MPVGPTHIIYNCVIAAIPFIMVEKGVQSFGSIIVRPVTGRREMGEFIRTPWHIYADDPLWVPPLRLERRLHFSRFNPFFNHGEWQAWVAYRDNQPIGRVSAQVDYLHRERYGTDTGHFGLLEGIESQEVFAALMDTAEKWLVDRGARQISGPFNFSINQECGILVEGFETPPVVMMPHSRRWYGSLLEAQGYHPLKDMLAYWVDVDFEAPPLMNALVERFGAHIRLRALNRSAFDDEMELLRDIFNDAWSNNWGFVPFTREEFKELGTTLRILVPDEAIAIAEVDGVPAAFMVGLPNLNEIFIELDGNVFPFGWARLIKRLRSRSVRTARIPLMGVRKKFQSTPLGAALAFMVIDALRGVGKEWGIRSVELSWILEDNKAMRRMLDGIGCREYKRYRIYGKRL